MQYLIKVVFFFTERCLICWDNLPRHIFIPCGHFGVCSDCKEKLEESEILKGCPFCNNTSSRLQEVYFCGKKYKKDDENIIYLLCKLNRQIKELNNQLVNEKNINIKIKKRLESINLSKDET